MNDKKRENFFMNEFDRIYDYVKEKSSTCEENLWIPSTWNVINYDKVLQQENGEIQVNMYDYLYKTFQYLMDLNGKEDKKSDICANYIYCAFIRYTTAWDYKHDGTTTTGTFLRAMLVLPLLKQMGISIMYILPVTKYSDYKMKGNIGSPYAIKNYFELDPNLHDSLLDELEENNLSDEFRAFVDACHKLNIKVITDFIPRVNARDSDLMKEHPDWFYWISCKDAENFEPPYIDSIDDFQECKMDNVDKLYANEAAMKHIEKFCVSPDEQAHDLWMSIVKESNETGKNLLELVENKMFITTAPAHSDWINDPQPIWTDITFLKMYKDFNPAIRKYLKEDQKPYVLFDTIKCSNFPCEEPNQELWDMFTEVIRHYLTSFNIDGFRIDMAHAAPTELMDFIVKQIKSIKSDAILMSEELFNGNHSAIANAGYTFMLGSTWSVMANATRDNLYDYIEEVKGLDLPIMGSPEIADTPRLVTREGGIDFARCMAVFNYFTPNTIPFINTGYEVNEVLPLNCGLADNTNGKPIEKAFFHNIAIQWNGENAQSMIDYMCQLGEIRKANESLILQGDVKVNKLNENAMSIGYQAEGQELWILLNLSSEKNENVSIKSITENVENLQVLFDSKNKLTEVGQEFILLPMQAVVIKSS